MTIASTQEQPQLHPFYRADCKAIEKAIAAKLSGSDWAVWSYLQLRDPFGGRYVKMSVAEIADATGYTKRTVQRSLDRLKKVGLWDWHPLDFEGRNPYGKTAIEKHEPNDKVVELPTKIGTTDLSPVPEMSATNLSEPAPTTNLSQPEPPLDKGEDKSVAISTNLSPSPETPRQICRDFDKSVAETTNLSSLRQICRGNDKFVAIDAQNPDGKRVSNPLDLLDPLDPLNSSDRADDEKINSSEEEELVREDAIVQVFGVGIDALKQAGIHAYERAGIEVVDRTTARVRYTNHPPFVQLLAWAMQMSDARGSRFQQVVRRWLAYVRGSDRPIRNPYGNLRAFVRNEFADD